MPPQRQRILVIEDDAKLADLIREYLERESFDVEIERRGDAGARRIADDGRRFDLLILDLMLPGIDGFEVCRRIRPSFHGKILMLTARGDEIDEVLGLELGADDYMTKPVRPRLMLSRIRALLRRSAGGSPAAAAPPRRERIVLGGLEVDGANRTVTLDGCEVELTTAEFDLLWFLAGQAGETVTRDAIFGAVKAAEYDGLDRSIDLRIARLRKKLGDDARHPRRIKSVRGVGYLMAPDPPKEDT